MTPEQKRLALLARARRRRAEAEAGAPAEEGFGERAIRASASTLGAPVDAVNAALGAVGLPTSETPFLGSRSIEGMMHAASGAKESREIASAAPGVTQDGGAPLSERAYESFMATPEATSLYLTKRYGAEGEGWYRLADRFGNPTKRIVVRDKDGREHLFNPPGIDLGDVASAAGGAPDLVGAIMGATASVPAYAAGPVAGIAATAAGSAIGAQAVGEPIARLFPENRAAEPGIAKDVLPRAAGEMADDALIGAVMGGAGRVAKGIANYARAPFANSAADPMAQEFRGAADRLKAQGYDIAPLPSESGAGGFVPRVEGLLEKLPGSAEKMRQYRQSGNEAVARFQRDIVGDGDAPAAGRSAVAEFEAGRDRLTQQRDQALADVDSANATGIEAIASRQGPQFSAEGAGQAGRAGLERARQEFRDEARRLYEAARNAPGGRDPIVDMTPVREEAARIRAALPPSARRAHQQETGVFDEFGAPLSRTVIHGGDPIVAFTPQGLSRFLNGVDDIAPNITIDQARQMRTIIDDAISDRTLLPGVPERFLGQLRQAVTRAIDTSVDAAGDPALRQALGEANAYYRENIDKFSRKGIAETFRPPTSQGYVEDNRIVDRLLYGRGAPGVLREMRETMGRGSPEWAAVRRNAVEQILDAGRNQTLYGRRVVSADGLVARLNALDDETIRELFSTDAAHLRRIAADVANRTKYLDADALSEAGTPHILDRLRGAAALDRQIEQEYRRSVIAPFLRGETGARAKLNPEELVPWLYRKAAPQEAATVMGRLEPATRQAVEKGIVADIVESSISQGRGDLSAVRRLVTDQADPASSAGIAEIMGAGRDVASRQQADRVAVLVSPENRQALRDLALITARRQERDATSSAIGGLAAGAAITGILSRPGRVLQASIVARGLAELITAPGFRRWLTNTRQSRTNPAAEARAIAAAPTVYDIGAGALAEDSDVQAALEWLNEGLSQIDAKGERIARPPQGAGNWEGYFGGGNDRDREMIEAITR